MTTVSVRWFLYGSVSATSFAHSGAARHIATMTMNSAAERERRPVAAQPPQREPRRRDARDLRVVLGARPRDELIDAAVS